MTDQQSAEVEALLPLPLGDTLRIMSAGLPQQGSAYGLVLDCAARADALAQQVETLRHDLAEARGATDGVLREVEVQIEMLRREQDDSNAQKLKLWRNWQDEIGERQAAEAQRDEAEIKWQSEKDRAESALERLEALRRERDEARNEIEGLYEMIEADAEIREGDGE